MSKKSKNTLLYVKGVCCAEEENVVRKKLSSTEGIDQFNFNIITQRLSVTHTCPEEKIIDVLNSSGFEAQRFEASVKPKYFWEKHSNLFFTTTAGLLTFFAIALNYYGVSQPVIISIFVVAICSGGWQIAVKGFRAVVNRALDMNFLMTIATLGAVIIGEFAEAAAVIFMFSLALLLESYSIARTRNAIRSLIELSPQTASIKNGNGEITKKVEDISIGEIIIVRPGERVSLDGIITHGKTSVNESLITGESLPVFKSENDPVYAGTINGKGIVEFRVTHRYRDTKLAHIIHLVEEAQSEKSKSQTFIEKFARYYTPSVVVIAILIAALPPLLFSQPFSEWFYRSLVMLVIACPCALVISTPVTIVSGITSAARNGVLIKGGRYLEEIGKISAIAIDKTGTLTEGKPKVVDVVPLNSVSSTELLRIAAAIEAKSEHPLAAAIELKAMEEDISFQDVEVNEFESFPGKGIKGVVGGKTYILGNHNFCEELQACNNQLESKLYQLESEGKTVVVIIEENIPIGVISVVDIAREESKQAISLLHNVGIKKVIMLTGDNEATARSIADELGIDDVRSQLLPEQKVEAIKELKNIYGNVGMAGDGVNDAPALAAASIGIAMGTAGTDAAIETSNIVLMADNLSKVSETIELSRKTLRIIKQNITIALVTKGIFLILGASGMATLWLAILADDGAALLVILNGLRLLKWKVQK